MAVSPPLNPILMELTGNGSLQGRDRAGIFSATGSGALRYAAAPAARTNWFTNPGLGSNSTSWSDAGSAVGTRTADTDFESDQCWSSVATASTSDGFNIFAQMRSVALSSAAITVGVSTKLMSGAADWQARAQLVDAAGTLIGSAGSFVDLVPGGTLARAALAITNPSDTGGSGVQIQFRRKSAAASTIRVGDITIESGVTAGTWFLPVWLDPITGQLGAPHTSPSVSRALFWVEEATTNLLLNPRFESNSMGWSTVATDGSLSGERDTTRAYIGSVSYKVTATANCVGGVSQQLASTTAVSPSAGSLTQSWYVFIPTAFSATEIELRFANYTGANEGSKVTVDLSKRNQWQRVARTATLDAGDLSGQISLRLTAGTMLAGESIWVACVQAEAKAYATSYCDGSIGTSYTWAGTAHASASTRAVSYVAATGPNRKSLTEGAQVARIRSVGSRGSDLGTIFVGGTANVSPLSGQYVQMYLSGTNQIVLQARSNGGSANAAVGGIAAIGTAVNAYSDQEPSVIRAGVLAGALASSNRTHYVANPLESDIVEVGAFASGNYYRFNGYIGPVATYDEKLSDTRSAMVNAAIDSNGATDLWTLFEEWEGIIQPADLLALQSGQATAGVKTELAPIDLLPLQSGRATAGVTAEVEALEMGLMSEPVLALGANGIRVIPLDWDD